MNSFPEIPKWPHRFFKWYCRAERYEELHGDLEEIYYSRYESLGIKKAKWLYTYDVVRCCQPYAWKSRSNYESNFMIKNYLKVSTRVIKKNPLSSSINLIGLSIAIGMCVLVYAFSKWTLSKDDFHKHKETVLMLTQKAKIADDIEEVGYSPKPLVELIKNDFVEIKNVCPIKIYQAVIKRDDNIFREHINVVDPSYLEMFTFPLKWGEAASLNDPNSIILSEEMAFKYFGSENPLGHELQLILTGEKSKLFKVTGVVQKFPETRSFSFDFLINRLNDEWINGAQASNDWTQTNDALFIQVSENSDLPRLVSSLNRYKDIYNQANPETPIITFSFQKLATLYKHSGTIKDSISSKSYLSNIKAIYFLSFIAIFMLALSCFNYINIAIVSSAKRLKEIGVRKTIGATNVKVIHQFLAENATFTLMAGFLGVVLGSYVIIPWFQNINSFKMDFTLADVNLWFFLIAILIFTSLAAGLYPSIVISRFHTAHIFKGAVRYGKENLITRMLLGFQIVMASVLLVSAFMFTSNSSFLANQSWGYKPQGIIYSVIDDSGAYLKLRDQLQQNPNVLEMTGGMHHVGVQHETGILQYGQENIEVQLMSVANNYLRTLEMSMSDGRNFNLEEGSDQDAVIINETLEKMLNLQSPIGASIRVNGESVMVVGVVNDFRYFDFDKKIEPSVFRVANENNMNFLVIRTNPKEELKVYKELQSSWSILFPEIPFQGGFQEDVWGPFFLTMELHGSFWRGIALVALLLASLGLYGLISLNVTGRVKEFSIRKVLGAELLSIYQLVIKSYIWLYTIALLVGALCSYYAVGFMLDTAYMLHAPISFGSIVTAAIVLIGVLLLVAGSQVRRLIKYSPIMGLKSE